MSNRKTIMLQKIKQLININNEISNIKVRLDYADKQISESIWANIYHDSIRGFSHLETLPLNIGRWAGNYSFFYILNRVLKDFQPKNILELGLGESSKFISTYIQNYLIDSQHVIAEHDINWINVFKRNFKLSDNSKIIELNLETKNIHGHEVISYNRFCLNFNEVYDFIIIDAPFGSSRFSRCDIVEYIAHKDFLNDFVIILDDTDRLGEKDTLKIIIELLKEKRDDIFQQTYSGSKSSTLISNIRFLTSL